MRGRHARAARVSNSRQARKDYRKTLTLLFVIISTIGVGCQPMQVALIDFYGPRSNEAELRACLPFKVNDTIQILTDSATYYGARKAILDCFKKAQPKIKQADLGFVCCVDSSKWIVYVGVGVENESKKIPERLKTNDIKLPTEITGLYDSLQGLLMEAIHRGEAGEDRSSGHALTDYLPMRKVQQEFIRYANANLNLLIEVLKTSKYGSQRAVAATVMGYYHNKAAIIKDLLAAVTDFESEVRNNAVRAIGVIADYAQSRPDLKLEIPANLFITMINSITWTDRNKSMGVLLSLTANRNKNLLDHLKRDALEPIVDMAKWKNIGHAEAGLRVLGRMAGWTEKEITDGMNDDREIMIDKMLAKIRN